MDFSKLHAFTIKVTENLTWSVHRKSKSPDKAQSQPASSLSQESRLLVSVQRGFPSQSPDSQPSSQVLQNMEPRQDWSNCAEMCVGDGCARVTKSSWVNTQEKGGKGQFWKDFKIPYSLTSLRQYSSEEVIMQLLQVEFVLLNFLYWLFITVL